MAEFPTQDELAKLLALTIKWGSDPAKAKYFNEAEKQAIGTLETSLLALQGNYTNEDNRKNFTKAFSKVRDAFADFIKAPDKDVIPFQANKDFGAVPDN